VLKWLDSRLRGFHQLLYLKDSETKSVETILKREFPSIVSRDEIENFLEEKGYASSTTFSVINQLLDNKIFYIYTSSQYINADLINFDETVKSSLKKYLDKILQNDIYISAMDLLGYTVELAPISKFEWKPQLITEFVSAVG